MKIRLIRSAAILICIATVFALFACSSRADGKEADSVEDTLDRYELTYTHSSYGTYTVTGINVIDGDGEQPFSVDIPAVYLGKPVTGISDSAFYGCSYISEVRISDSIAFIGEECFSHCERLGTIDIGNGIAFVGADAFYGCDDLRTVRYWGTVADWCSISFVNANSNPLVYSDDFYIDGARAVTVSIPMGVKTVKPYTFVGCRSIRSLSFSSDTASIGAHAFEGCVNLTDIKLIKGLIHIGSYAFSSAPVYTVTLPESLTTIEPYAFSGCRIYEIYDLSELGIEKDQDANAMYVNGGVAFNVIDIRTDSNETSGLKPMGDYYFYSADSGDNYLVGVTATETKMILPTTEYKYKIADGVFAFRGDLVKITLSESVTEIGQLAFLGCEHLSEIDIPTSLKKSGAGAFLLCNAIEYVNYGGSIDDWNAIEFAEELSDGSVGLGETSDPLCYGAYLYIDGVPRLP